jgi:hypothetical protein
MEELTYTEYNCTTGETIVRPLTDAERADYEEIKRISAERLATETAAAEALATLKASARTKLVAGEPLTPEEAATIVL